MNSQTFKTPQRYDGFGKSKNSFSEFSLKELTKKLRDAIWINVSAKFQLWKLQFESDIENCHLNTVVAGILAGVPF